MFYMYVYIFVLFIVSIIVYILSVICDVCHSALHTGLAVAHLVHPPVEYLLPLSPVPGGHRSLQFGSSTATPLY